MSAFQANDESSILSARTKEKSHVVRYDFFLWSVLKHRTLIVTSATSDEKFDNKEQDRKVYFSERDAVVKHSLRPHQK